MLYCIVGPSCSGKTYLAEHLPIPRVMTVTTRAPRKDEVNGLDYIFTSRRSFEELERTRDLMAITRYGDAMYGIPAFDIRTAPDACIVVDAAGYLELSTIAPESVRCILLAIPAEVRIQRMMENGHSRAEAVARIGRDTPVCGSYGNVIVLSSEEEVDQFIANFKT